MPVVNTIESLTTATQIRVRKFLAEVAKRKIAIRVLETYRSQEVQNAYYAQGRKTLAEVNVLRQKAGLYLLVNQNENYIITQTLSSLHTKRTAIDIVPLNTQGAPDWDVVSANAQKRWLALGAIGEKFGLNWGGRWKVKQTDVLGWDCGHFELNPNWRPPIQSFIDFINSIISFFR